MRLPVEALAKQYVSLNINSDDLDLSDIIVPYQTRRAGSGAIIIQPESSTLKDPLDLPSSELQKVVRGLIWRDEHFKGVTLKDIAVRENCSQAYVGTAICKSFDVLMQTR